MTTQVRQPMRNGTAKRPVKKAKAHQTDLFDAMQGKSNYTMDMFTVLVGNSVKDYVKNNQ